MAKTYECPTCRQIYTTQGGRVVRLMSLSAVLGLAMGVLAGVTAGRR